MTNEAQAFDSEDLDTTAPSPSGEWRMPEPIFRKTSGKLPQGFEKNYAPAVEPDSVSQADEPLPETGPVESYAEPKPRSPILKIVVVVLGLVAMIGFLIAFLSVVYFLFLR